MLVAGGFDFDFPADLDLDVGGFTASLYCMFWLLNEIAMLQSSETEAWNTRALWAVSFTILRPWETKLSFLVRGLRKLGRDNLAKLFHACRLTVVNLRLWGGMDPASRSYFGSNENSVANNLFGIFGDGTNYDYGDLYNNVNHVHAPTCRTQCRRFGQEMVVEHHCGVRQTQVSFVMKRPNMGVVTVGLATGVRPINAVGFRMKVPKMGVNMVQVKRKRRIPRKPMKVCYLKMKMMFLKNTPVLGLFYRLYY
ncbi:hypothetical protein RHMOL_Rhmol04G0127300 [Rhododendron molle]|uniref:Uncharacterized protein n=1 Tax=Rhododendron molle TaxID=49168 RepID=A0ACC0P1C2_RHOML|nr:hypothetical protein RHMOL_Rhmol04G0127300 [Rhododendron molle]